jgi:hypothetical protein
MSAPAFDLIEAGELFMTPNFLLAAVPTEFMP